MASSSGLEVADIVWRFGPAFRETYRGHLNRSQLRTLGAIEACRTAALGGHVYQCAHCGARKIVYNSCRNRHCPKCQGLDKCRVSRYFVTAGIECAAAAHSGTPSLPAAPNTRLILAMSRPVKGVAAKRAASADP